MRLDLDLQLAVTAPWIPSAADFQRWAEAALDGRREAAELVVRVVDQVESAQLNERFRGKAGATNILSFPFQAPPPVRTDLLGDLVICAPVVRQEAAEQGKEEADHWAHMLVHGVLHLLGYDHLQEAEAQQMEALERQILARLGLPDPYADEGGAAG